MTKQRRFPAFSPYATRASSRDALPASLAPITEDDRIVSLDVLRGFAVLGILVLNIQSFAMVGSAYINPNAYGSLDGANGWVWHLTHVLGDQKFMSIFSMLFGAGIVLMTTRTMAATGRSAELHYRRMGWLLLVGLLHAHLLWYGDILFTFALCGMVLYLLRRLPPVWLFVLAFVCLLVASGISVFFGYSMPYWPEEQVQTLNDETWFPLAEIVQAELDAYRGGWFEQMYKRVPTAFFFETFLLVLGGFGLKAAAMMLTGMGLFKLGVLSAARSAKTYALMAVIGLGIGFAMAEFGVRQNIAHDWEIEYSFYYGTQYNFWGSAVASIGYVGVVMLVVKLNVLGVLTRTLSAVGRMALTNYLMQTIICTTIFYGHGFGQFGRLERIEQVGVVAAIWAAQLIWSPLWLKHYRMGPFEWVWRSLSYWRMQPLRR